MHWTEPASADDSHADLEKRLWDAANKMWADAALKPSEFSPIVLGLIFLRYAETRFVAVEKEIGPATGRRKIGPADYHAKGVLYLPEEARFGHLLQLPEGGNIGQAVNDAMRAVEKENPDLADVLPKTCQILENRTLTDAGGISSCSRWLSAATPPDPSPHESRTPAGVPAFSRGAGRVPREIRRRLRSPIPRLTTPPPMASRRDADRFPIHHPVVSLVPRSTTGYRLRSRRDPYEPNFSDAGGIPSCCWWSSAATPPERNRPVSAPRQGGQRLERPARLARLNLAVHGLSGDIRQGNTYYEELGTCLQNIQTCSLLVL